MINWIDLHAKEYREFLNSVKVLAVASKVYAKALNKAIKDLSRDDIDTIEAIVNEDKNLLEGVF